MFPSKEIPVSIDCALITALNIELDILRFHFRHSKPIIEGSNTYLETMSPNGLSLVGAVSREMGADKAAALMMGVIKKYQPKTIIEVGIAAGLDRSIGLGDVVISNEIVSYILDGSATNPIPINWS